jgi:hypothetical protein
VVKSVTVLGKCYAISDGDRPGNKKRVVLTGADCVCTYVPYAVVMWVQPQSVSRIGCPTE